MNIGPKCYINRNGYGMAVPCIRGVLGISGCIIWVIYPLVDALVDAKLVSGRGRF